MDQRQPEDREAELRALGILEHNLQVTHDHPPQVVHDGAGREALVEFRRLAQDAEKAHQSERRAGRRHTDRSKLKSRLRWLWAIPLILIWAAAAIAIVLLLRGGEIFPQ